jgi:predicted DNA-binding transcriptional regulator AlpA
MTQAKKKPAAQVAPARKAARLKAESKARTERPASDAAPRAIEGDAPIATPISASPLKARAPPRKFHFVKRIPSIADAPGGDDDLLSAAELAAWFGMSVEWVDIGRSEGYGPPYVKLGRLVRYRRGTVREWLLARIHHSTSEYGR